MKVKSIKYQQETEYKMEEENECNAEVNVIITTPTE